MSAWPRMRLDECCQIISGATPKTTVPAYWDGDICWATPKDLGDLDGMLIEDTPRKITTEGLHACSAAILPVGSVLFSSRAPIGHVAINTVPMTTNQGFKSLIPKTRMLEAKYLYYWLKCHRTDLEALGNGVTFKEVSKAVVSRVEIPVPSLDEQRRIAAILGQADALRANKQAALALLGELAQAIFVEMFGDPTSSRSCWSRVALHSIACVVTGNTPSRTRNDYYGSDFEWIKSDNLNTGSYYVTRSSEHLSELGRKVARTAPAGATLVTCIAGSPGSIGNSSMLDREAAFNQQINAVIPVSVDPHFLYAQLRVGKILIQDGSTGAMKGMVSKSRFEKIIVINPPAEMQKRFAKSALAVEAQKKLTLAAFEAANALFASLQHRAFAGEL